MRMKASQLDLILQEFSQSISDIEGAILVSSQGQPITQAIGLEENTSQIVAGTILSAAAQLQAENQWSRYQQVCIRTPKGCVTLVACTEDIFLLVKTKKALSGLLEREIQQLLRQIQQALQGNTPSATHPSVPKPIVTQSAAIAPGASVDAEFIRCVQQELAQFIGPIAPLVCHRLFADSPHWSMSQFIEALARKIPDRQQAIAFEQRMLALEWVSPNTSLSALDGGSKSSVAFRLG